MGSKRCFEIKDLEEKLLCLEEKYKDLTTALEQERTVDMISDEAGNLHEILVEREFVKRQIDVTKSRIRCREKLISRRKRDSTIVDIGSRVRLENHRKSLDIHLVDEHDAQPSKGFISILSPIGRAIFGKGKGEEIMVNLPNGQIEYTIKEIL